MGAGAIDEIVAELGRIAADARGCAVLLRRSDAPKARDAAALLDELAQLCEQAIGVAARLGRGPAS